MIRNALALCLALASLALGAAPWHERAWKSLMERFYLPETGIIYDTRNGEGRSGLVDDMPTPEEIAANKPCTTGWGTGMEDSVLTGCPLLLAAIDRWDLTHDEEARTDGRKILKGLFKLATVSGVRGFLARSICPKDGKSFYINSSRDQYTLFIYTLWHYAHSSLATPEEKATCTRLLVDIASFWERTVTKESGWRFANSDGTPGMVARMWTDRPGVLTGGGSGDAVSEYGGLCAHEALRLPMAFAAAYELTGDPHWREQELRYVDAGIEMAFGYWPDSGLGYAAFQAQISHLLLMECEKDPIRREKYAELLRKYARSSAAQSAKAEQLYDRLGGRVNVYGTDWRKLPVRPTWEDKNQTMVIFCQDFIDGHDGLREASEGMLNSLLAPGVEVPAICRQVFEKIYGNLDYDHTTTSAGLAHALFAYWRERALVRKARP